MDALISAPLFDALFSARNKQTNPSVVVVVVVVVVVRVIMLLIFVFKGKPKATHELLKCCFLIGRNAILYYSNPSEKALTF